MLLQCGCAAVATVENDAEKLIASDNADVEMLAAESAYVARLEAVDYAYVRGGGNADKTFSQIRPNMDRLEFKCNSDTDIEANTAYSRQFFVQFDAYDLRDKLDSFNTARITFNVAYMDGNGDSFSVFYVSDDVDLQKVTWNNRPMGELITTGYSIRSLAPYDLGDYVKRAINECGGVLTLRFAPEKLTGSEGQIKCAGSDVPTLTLTKSADTGDSAYLRNLVSDPVANQAIWDHAKKVYDSWYERYQLLLKKKESDPEIPLIESDPKQYNMVVSSFGTNASRNEAKHNTRTVGALTDISNYVDMNTECEFDIYGGLMDPMLRQEARGHFYTKRIGDRWWMIDPLGYPCYLRALSGITYEYSANSPNQLPSVLEKYGSKEKWGISATRHVVDDLYFNLTTSKVNEVLSVEQGIFKQTSIGSFAGGYGSKIGVNASKGGSTTFKNNNTMPVFDPGFETYSDELAKTVTAPYIGDKMLIGYTTDNELPMETDMLMNYLNVDPTLPENYYSYACTWTWLVNITGEENPADAAITPELKELFRGFVWDRYYNVVCGAVRKYDPDHMLLGTRFLTGVRSAEWVLRFASLYLDAITINWYFTWEPQAESLQQMSTYSQLPLIITEFYAKAKENEGNLQHTDTSAGWLVQTQADRGYFYQNFTLRLLECKNVIGWHWFQYLDCDPAGTQTDQSSLDSNKGIMSNTHKEYTDLTEKMVEINKNVYHLINYFDAKYAK